MLRRINPLLSDMILKLILYGLIIQFTGVWFVQNKLSYSIGLWIGIVVAAVMAINMSVIILDTVESSRQKRASIKNAVYAAIRYISVIAVIVITNTFHLGNLITLFLGIMGLKAAAYMQLFTHKSIKEKIIE